MRALSVVFFIAAFGLGIWILICSFSTWIALWGVGGAVFNFFLFPVAILGYPFVQWKLTGGVLVFWSYLDIALVIAFYLLGRFTRERSFEA
jgi:hypothetical protein